MSSSSSCAGIRTATEGRRDEMASGRSRRRRVAPAWITRAMVARERPTAANSRMMASIVRCSGQTSASVEIDPVRAMNVEHPRPEAVRDVRARSSRLQAVQSPRRTLLTGHKQKAAAMPLQHSLDRHVSYAKNEAPVHATLVAVRQKDLAKKGGIEKRDVIEIHGDVAC